MFHNINIDGREYRYSDERRVSGRPAVIEYRSAVLGWRQVRSVDRSDQIWRIADGDETPAEYNRRNYPETMARLDALVAQVRS